MVDPTLESLESASKKVKLEVSSPTWADHRETATIPPTPKVAELPNLNETFETIPNSPVTEENTEGTNLNETVTLVTKLDRQCELNSPAAVKTAPRNLNSTFAIDEEPMDVDSTSNMKTIPPLMSSLSVSDMSIIHPPTRFPPKFSSPHSPVKAGMGVPSPANSQQRRSPSPLPLRQSTLLDIKTGSQPKKPSPTAIPRRSPRTEVSSALMAPPVRGAIASARKGRPTPSKSSTTPQPVRKTVAKRSLAHSVSTSVLPRPGQPVSFRSTIARLNPESDAEHPAYMHSTANSKMRHGGTMDRKKSSITGSMVNLAKENPGIETGKSKGFSSVTNKLGNGLGRLKKSVSSNVLKSNNKN
eukprot:GFUD01009756.1.p1 GENE.GFUD01009756.1~~GFUD01009756.1.p1  ORF type:complete len:357 (+),score=106.91 GFUD01009756.1:125-1195(+)